MNEPSIADDCGWVGAGRPGRRAGPGRAAWRPTCRRRCDPTLGHLDATRAGGAGRAGRGRRDHGRAVPRSRRRPATRNWRRSAGRPAGRSRRKRRARYFAINYGPWDRRFHYEPFFGSWPHPEGANFYPLDLTDAEKARIAGPGDGLDGLSRMVRRDEAGAARGGALRRRSSRGPLSRGRRRSCAAAAARRRTPASRRSSTSRADGVPERRLLRVGRAVDGPRLAGRDHHRPVRDLRGRAVRLQGVVRGVRHRDRSRCSRSGWPSSRTSCPGSSSSCRCPTRDKNPNRGSESPIRVVDLVYSGGDTRAGVQTIAFNLPNDERVREAKGSKKVLLRNVMNAKFDADPDADRRASGGRRPARRRDRRDASSCTRCGTR